MMKIGRFESSVWELAQRGIAGLLLLPAFGVALPFGILIRLHSRGPLLISSRREGRDGVAFSTYKLRTMVSDAESVLRRALSESDELSTEWRLFGRLQRDPRIAGPVARLARRWSVDELPQLLNVVLGQMNLIGPRPLPLDVVTQMTVEDRRRRQRLLPGITGLWQVSGRSELSIEAMGRLDSLYASKRSVAFDIAILVRTIRAVLSGRGAY